LNEFGDALEGCDQVSLEMHLEAEIECLIDALAGPDHVELRDALAGHDTASIICNNPGFCQNHPGLPVGSDGSDKTS
jgi:hypothetical protein